MAFNTLNALELVLVAMAMLTAYCALTTRTVVCLVVLSGLWTVYRWVRKRNAGTIHLLGKFVLITGCDSGFGLTLSKHLHTMGCHVIATVLLPEGPGAKELRALSPQTMTVIPLDVSSDESVSACLKTVKVMCQSTGLWGLVNNAGINFMGEVELTTMAQYLHIANVNIFGMVRCTRAFLPLLRQAKGRIVNVTSIKGLLSTPVNAAYNITKYGGETFSDIVRLEMRQFGVKVIVIEPGNFGAATGCINTEGMKRIRKDFDLMWEGASDDVRQMFSKKHLDKMLADAESSSAATTCPTLTPVINAMTEALTSGDPEIRYIVDGSNSLFDKYCVLARVKPFVPAKTFDQLTTYFFPYSVQK